MRGKFPVEKFREIETPFYYYDMNLLRDTLDCVREAISRDPNFHVHYAVKANANPDILRTIARACFGADCVSGGEILAAVKAGFPGSKIVYAGVGKTDREINIGLDNDIFCFNVESVPELEVINELAAAKGKVAAVALRVNPNVGAHTHANITTG
ncbi:MAG: diaminopimelate decarboxylase, partial [Muribaculaceae bacterium]|nr:diaminopimelate decarboxylase [Muribaculaceae bacterium]